MISKEAEHAPHSQEREKKLIKDKEALEKKLESCAEIVKEMENFYDG